MTKWLMLAAVLCAALVVPAQADEDGDSTGRYAITMPSSKGGATLLLDTWTGRTWYRTSLTGLSPSDPPKNLGSWWNPMGFHGPSWGGLEPEDPLTPDEVE